MNLRNERNWRKAIQLFSDKDFPAAKAACEAILASDPGHPLANWMLSTLALNAGAFRAATEHALRAAGAAEAVEAQWLLNITWALMCVGENERAVQLIVSNAARFVGVPSLPSIAASQLAMLDRHEDAKKILIHALAINAGDPALHSMYGTMLQNTGELREAQAQFIEAVTIDPGNHVAYWSLAKLAGHDGAAQRIGALRKIHAASSENIDQRAHACYALFHELDRAGETDDAWRFLAEGAALRARQLPFDEAAESAIVSAIIAGTPLGFADTTTAPIDDVTPLFIVGMPRTGTTLVERILGNHPDVAICGELNDLRMQFKWTTDHNCQGYIDLYGATRLPELDASELGRRYREKTAWLTSGKRFFSDKNQTNFLFCGLILKALPRARIIHLRRSPMDSCFSNFKELFSVPNYSYSYSLEGLAAHYRNYSRLMSHWHHIAPDRILDVDYESLVGAPEQQAQRILSYCGLSRVEKVSEITNNHKPVSTASSAQVRQPIHSRNVDGWRRYAAQLQPLRMLLGDKAQH